MILRDDASPGAPHHSRPLLRRPVRGQRGAATRGRSGRPRVPDECHPLPAERPRRGRRLALARVPRRVARRAPHAGGQARRDAAHAGLPPVGDRRRGRRGLGRRPRPGAATSHLDAHEQGGEAHPPAGGADLRLGRERRGVARVRRERRGGTRLACDQPRRRTRLRGRRALGVRDRRLRVGAVASRRRARALRRHALEATSPAGGRRAAHTGANDSRRRLAVDHRPWARPAARRPCNRRAARHDRDRAAGIDVVAVGSRLAVISATAAGAQRGDPIVAGVSWVDPATGAVAATRETTSATR